MTSKIHPDMMHPDDFEDNVATPILTAEQWAEDLAEAARETAERDRLDAEYNAAHYATTDPTRWSPVLYVKDAKP